MRGKSVGDFDPLPKPIEAFVTKLFDDEKGFKAVREATGVVDLMRVWASPSLHLADKTCLFNYEKIPRSGVVS